MKCENTSPKICYFGEILVETRKQLLISQYQLSKLSGISERYLNFLEHGRVEPRIHTVIRLAVALNIPPGDMINAVARRMGVIFPHNASNNTAHM